MGPGGKIDIEDPDHPATRNLSPSFSITDEIYQFREFNRKTVRVLMTLDTTSVDPRANGVNRTDNDFALAWTRLYGSGRVFYTALGHFDETWRDPRFQQMIEQALLWITGQIEGDGSPREATQSPIIHSTGNSATLEPRGVISPGSFVINPRSESQLRRDDGCRCPHSSLSPRWNANILERSSCTAHLRVARTNQLPRAAQSRSWPVGANCRSTRRPPVTFSATFADWTPGVFTTTIDGRYATLWCTGLGVVRRNGQFFETVATPRVLINDQPATMLFSGLAPGWPGLYQINIELPPGAALPFRTQVTIP